MQNRREDFRDRYNQFFNYIITPARKAALFFTAGYIVGHNAATASETGNVKVVLAQSIGLLIGTAIHGGNPDEAINNNHSMMLGLAAGFCVTKLLNTLADEQAPPSLRSTL